MANTVVQNINKIVQTKYELKSILQAVGATPTDDFNTYAEMFIEKLAELENTANDINGE